MSVEPIRKAAPTGEIGASGLQVSGGRVLDEFHVKLKGQRAAKTYREMTDNDPVIGSLLFGIDMLLREVSWRSEPNEQGCAECERWSTFLDECRDDMSMTWPQTISAIGSFLPFGWAFTETVYKTRGGETDDATTRSKYADGLVGWRKIALRIQESLLRWEFDEQGGLQAFVQASSSGRGETSIPIERGLLFRTTAARGNPEGRSVLRNAYRPWYFKKRIEEIEAIGVERDLAGLPVAGIPPQYLDSNATAEEKAVLDAIKELVVNIRRDEQEGIVFPREIDPETGHDAWDLKLLSSGGKRQFDTDAIVARYDQRIAMTVLADFILLGHENVGSKALGVSKIELFTKALSAFMDEIASVLNEYGVSRLMRFNGVSPEHWPVLVHDDVKQTDLAELGTYIDALAGAGVVLDEALEAHLRSTAGLPQREAEPSEM